MTYVETIEALVAVEAKNGPHPDDEDDSPSPKEVGKIDKRSFDRRRFNGIHTNEQKYAQAMELVLGAEAWSISDAAWALGINRAHLSRRLTKFNAKMHAELDKRQREREARSEGIELSRMERITAA